MKKDLTEVKGYIYKVTAPNDKIYIGQTIRLKNRKYSYKNNDFKTQTKLWNSCQKHNWNPIDNFEIIEECLCGENKSFLNEREIYWIAFYDSFNKGLNCNLGGGSNFGYKVSDETKLKMSKAARGRKFSEDHKQKLSNAKKGKITWNTGKVASIESKKKMSDARNKLFAEGYQSYNKGIKKTEKEKQNMSEKMLQYYSENISFCKDKKLEEIVGIEKAIEMKKEMRDRNLGKKLSEDHKQKISENNKGKLHNDVKNVSINGIIYRSCKEAAEFYKCTTQNIFYKLKNTNKKYKDWFFTNL